MTSTPRPTTRRALVRAGAAVGVAGAGTLLTPVTAAAAPAYRPARYPGKPLLSPQSRHLVNRFSYGLTPALTAEVRRAGGARRWFEKQLEPSRVSNAGVADPFTWWGLSRGPAEMWRRQIEDVEGVWEVMANYARASLVRRMTSRRQVLEVMTEFWENHLHVPANGDAHGLFRKSYGDVIRRHALGRFDEMLQATTVHPAMLVYLDGAVSTARHPNENLGRELLELHTVGRGHYTEDDVKASARILTGWRVDMWRSWEASYKPEDHAVGPVQVMDFGHENAARDGRAVTAAYLRHLAHHPATARRIARKLAVKFVRDDPSDALVERLAQVYLDNDTAIKPVLRALVDSPEFRGSPGAKVRDPGEDVVASYRALGVKLGRPAPGQDEHAANALLWQCSTLGATPFGWTQPNGPPLDGGSWSSPSRLIASMQLHYSLSGGWWPKTGITYRTPRRWMPRRRMRFDRLVDHLSQQLLGRRSTPQLLKACCEAVDVRPREVIGPDHGLVRWNFHRLLATFLDSPAHLTH